MIKTYLAPWPKDPNDPLGPLDNARYPAEALERHAAHTAALNLPFNTHPTVVAQLLTDEIRKKGDEAVERYREMVAWTPKGYDPTNTRRVKDDILVPGYRHYAFWGGRGGSKSHDAAEAIIELASTRYERVVCGREFMASIRDSSRSLLVQKIRECPWFKDWTITDTELRNNRHGSLITFMGMNRNPDSARSLEGCTIFFGEEAEAFSQESLEVLLPTIRAPGSRCVWLWNPVDGGPVDDMFNGDDPPERSFVRCVLSDDNIFFYRTEMPAERRLAFKKYSPAKFRHIWRGALDINPELTVYQNWRVERMEVPNDSVPYYGLDWGWVDPLAAVEVFVFEPEDMEAERGIIYISAEIYQSRLPLVELPDILDAKMPLARSHTIIADSSEPKSIADLNDNGFYVIGANKGPGSIRAGISFIQGYDIVVSPDCPNVAAELAAYRWKKTRAGRILRDPEDMDNHAMDALRYALSEYVPAGMKDGGVFYI